MDKSAIKVLVFVLVMGTVAGGLLVGVNSYTAPLIAKNEELKLKSSVLDALDITYEKGDILGVFDKNVKILDKQGYVFYSTPDGSIAFQFSGPGLWGPISGIISLEKDAKTVRKIKITHQEETPGLGARISEAGYLAQFKNKEVIPNIVFMPQGKAEKRNEVDAITGATLSCKAFEKVINENVQKYLRALKVNS